MLNLWVQEGKHHCTRYHATDFTNRKSKLNIAKCVKRNNSVMNGFQKSLKIALTVCWKLWDKIQIIWDHAETYNIEIDKVQHCMLVRRVKWDNSSQPVGNSKADNEQQQHDVISALRLESSNWTNSIRDLKLWFVIPETVSSINVSYLSNTTFGFLICGNYIRERMNSTFSGGKPKKWVGDKLKQSNLALATPSLASRILRQNFCRFSLLKKPWQQAKNCWLVRVVKVFRGFVRTV